MTTHDGIEAPHPHERSVLLWMCVLIAVNQGGFGAVIPVLPLYAKSFGVAQAAIGATVAVYGLARLFSAFPAGRIADLAGRRSALAIGGLISGCGNLWCAWAGSFAELVVARFVAGFGAGLTLTTGMIVLADITTVARRGRIMAIYQGVFLFVVGIGPLPGGYLAERFGLEVPFLVYGVSSLIAAAIAWFMVRETRPTVTPGVNSTTPEPPRFTRQLRTILQTPGFTLVSAVGFCNAFGRTGALFSLIPIIGATRLGLSATQIGLAMAIGSLCGVVLTYPAGILVDRLGRKAVIVPTTLATALAFVSYGLTTSYAGFLGAAALWGVASAAAGAAPSAYAADVAPRESMATAMSAYRTLGDAGYVVGPLVLGLIADQVGIAAAVYTAAGLLAIAGITFGLRAPETRTRSGG